MFHHIISEFFVETHKIFLREKWIVIHRIGQPRVSKFREGKCQILRFEFRNGPNIESTAQFSGIARLGHTSVTRDLVIDP
jgi:hypothetical protein